jgi:hypothetical protein
LLRLEGGALFALGLLLYWKVGGNWLAFIILLLTPDIAMLGYLRDERYGAALYNLAHFSLVPAVIAMIGIIAGNGAVLAVALIWFSHINMDRLVGYGLKLPTGFKDTHLGGM